MNSDSSQSIQMCWPVLTAFFHLSRTWKERCRRPWLRKCLTSSVTPPPPSNYWQWLRLPLWTPPTEMRSVVVIFSSMTSLHRHGLFLLVTYFFNLTFLDDCLIGPRAGLWWESRKLWEPRQQAGRHGREGCCGWHGQQEHSGGHPGCCQVNKRLNTTSMLHCGVSTVSLTLFVCSAM